MLITPNEVVGYTVFEQVKNRPYELLELDIVEAEVEVKSIVGHDLEELAILPETARLALLKLAQFFALINSDESIIKGYKSERIGDYSYQLADGNTMRKPDVYDLLKDLIKERPVETGMKFRMRAL